MLQSTQIFLEGILDYAGMYPPAKLELRDAWRNFLDYRRTSPYAWILGRFVCPIGRLGDLADLLQEAPAVRIACVGPPLANLGNLGTEVVAHIQKIEDFNQAANGKALVDVMELALPSALPPGALAAEMSMPRQALAKAKMRAYFEIPSGPSLRNDLAEFAQWAHGPDADSRPMTSVGLKLRCGGLTREAFPSDEDMARFIICCRDASIPWKATAGLHHPRRFWDANLHLWHQGFVNLFGAALLAVANRLTEEEVRTILADRDGYRFRFEQERFAWKEWLCPLEKMKEIRAGWHASFGSCSFEEPCADMVHLGLLEGALPA